MTDLRNMLVELVTEYRRLDSEYRKAQTAQNKLRKLLIEEDQYVRSISNKFNHFTWHDAHVRRHRNYNTKKTERCISFCYREQTIQDGKTFERTSWHDEKQVPYSEGFKDNLEKFLLYNKRMKRIIGDFAKVRANIRLIAAKLEIKPVFNLGRLHRLQVGDNKVSSKQFLDDAIAEQALLGN